MRRGELVVFGSAALTFWLPDAPATRDVDVWCDPPDRGEAVEALMGELSWYHERHGAYVEVWAPETFAPPSDWRTRARTLTAPEFPDVRLVVPHPHDVLLAKVERWSEADAEHARLILRAFPLDASTLADRDRLMPHRDGRVADAGRVAAYEHHLVSLRRLISAA